MNDDLAIYIHFLYCKSRCPYCDFFRALKPKVFDEEALVERYLNDAAYFAKICGKRRVKSVFFGGGTPSLLSAKAVGRVLEGISQHFLIKNGAEISLEANPNTFEQEKFLDFKKAGVNRLSLGVQALHAEGLKFLGRTHSLDEAMAAAELGVKTFEKFSLDLIYARPKQTWEAWQKEIDLALSLGVKHISLYELSIEEGTTFYKKNIQALEEEKAAKLYEQTISYLREKGFERYEVSNFAVDEENQSTHNLTYWQGGDYLGIGEGAHGRLRVNNKIFATLDGRIAEEISAFERAEELLFMGLRLQKGIEVKRFFSLCGVPLFRFLNTQALKRLAKLNLVYYDDEQIRVTDKGFLVLDEIIRELLG